MKQPSFLLSHLLATVILLSGTLATHAVVLMNFTIDGIVYRVNDAAPSTVTLKKWNSTLFNANPVENWTIPSKVTYNDITYTVTKLAPGCLKNFKHFKSKLSIPSEVTTIGANAFEGSNVQSVYGGDNVQELGDEAFKNCTELMVMVVNKKVKTIGARCFSGCTFLKSNVYNGGNLTSIGDEAFADCTSLPAEINFNPSAETTLGNEIFKGCTQVKSVIMNGKSIVSGTAASSPFLGCTGLKRVVISTTVDNLSFSASEELLKEKKQNFFCIADGVYPVILVQKGDEASCAILLSGDGVKGYKEILPYTLRFDNLHWYNGICRTMGFDVEKMKANDAYGVDNVYAFTRIENDKLYFNAVKTAVPGMPYVLKSKSDDCCAIICEEGEAMDYNTDLSGTDSPFKGAFKGADSFFVHYNLNADGGFTKEIFNKVGAWSVYLIYDSDKEYLESVYDDTVTGIEGVTTSKVLARGKWYDLQGRIVAHPQKGTVYVRDGKKVVY